jgi:hypothetical protein
MMCRSIGFLLMSEPQTFVVLRPLSWAVQTWNFDGATSTEAARLTSRLLGNGADYCCASHRGKPHNLSRRVRFSTWRGRLQRRVCHPQKGDPEAEEVVRVRYPLEGGPKWGGLLWGLRLESSWNSGA